MFMAHAAWIWMDKDADGRVVADTRKRFSSLYSMSSLVHYEAFVDDCADVLSLRLLEHADRQLGLNMGHWFQCYAFDVISSITFGGRFGKTSRLPFFGGGGARVNSTDM